MGFSEDQILLWFSQYAYQPILVYGAVIVLMVLSSFGFPAPEEVTLLTMGLVCYMGSRPDLYPPPYEGAPVVDKYVAASVACLAVFLSDFLIFYLGRRYGSRLLKTRRVQRFSDTIEKGSMWVKRYGKWAAGAFRFTPGLRFPGHFSCGMMGLSPGQFLAVDGLAVLISVPTQVLLIASYGETIVENLKQFKLVFFGIIFLAVVIFFIRKWLQRKKPEVSV